MRLASIRRMTLTTRLVVGSGIVAAALLARRWWRRRGAASAALEAEIAPEAVGADALGAEALSVEALTVDVATVGVAADRGAGAVVPPGLSEVDPQPLIGMGEAVDPDAVQAAHRDVRAQRDRLPVPGKNLP